MFASYFSKAPAAAPPPPPPDATVVSIPALKKPETLKNVDKLPVRLVICLDGTGDTASGSFDAVEGIVGGTKDSIKSIYDMVQEGVVVDEGTGRKMFQYAQYFEGVGTVNVSKGGVITRVHAIFDGATGNGYLDILRNAYKVCCQQCQNGAENEIFIFGFSRGAFIARALASFVQYSGLIKEEFLDKKDTEEKLYQERFQELLNKYVENTKGPLWGGRAARKDITPRLQHFCIPPPAIPLLGAFDTVKTVIPLPLSNLFFHKNASINFLLDSPLVQHFRHALALNEARVLFNPDLWHEPSPTDKSSYLEAWFFGFHHDIGGGDERQGLALWPLQWILSDARKYGLVLDKTVSPWDVLFAGAEQTCNTPHQTIMSMYDSLAHHTSTLSKVWGLRLNEPHSYLIPVPRSYWEFLTEIPYRPSRNPKKFLHPSAYALFDVSTDFRLQIYEWKWFRTFIAGRENQLGDVAPWWEEQCRHAIVGEGGSVEHINILVMGRKGTGKREMVGKLFGEMGNTPTNINTPILIPNNDQVRIYYSDGLGSNSSDTEENIQRFLSEHDQTAKSEDQIHALWYFLDVTISKIPDTEKKVFSLKFGDIPVLVVLRNEDKLRDMFREDNVDEQDDGGQLKINRQLEKAIEALKEQMTRLPVKKFVQARNPRETPKKLLTETTSFSPSHASHLGTIKAQRVSLLPKVALATEESVRAYTIWHSPASHSFKRNADSTGMSLAHILLEPVLATFNARYSGDDELLEKKLGAGGTWAGVGGKTDLNESGVKGEAVLAVMIDAVVVMSSAWDAAGEGKLPGRKEVEQACQAYTTAPKGKQSKQIEVYEQILSFLDKDGGPRGGSIAALQMKVVELVDKETREEAGVLKKLTGMLGGWIV